jgi:hypothetical protein
LVLFECIELDAVMMMGCGSMHDEYRGEVWPVPVPVWMTGGTHLPALKQDPHRGLSSRSMKPPWMLELHTQQRKCPACQYLPMIKKKMTMTR